MCSSDLDEQNDGGEVNGIHHADVQALLGHDQGHLAAGHHANTHLEGIAPAEPADLGRQPAADDLGDQGHHHEAHAEQQDLRGQAADIGLEADGGKEDGRKEAGSLRTNRIRDTQWDTAAMFSLPPTYSSSSRASCSYLPIMFTSFCPVKRASSNLFIQVWLVASV